MHCKYARMVIVCLYIVYVGQVKRLEMHQVLFLENYRETFIKSRDLY